MLALFTVSATLAVPEAAAQATVGGAGFTLTASNTSSVTLDWQPGSAQAGYRLTRLDPTGVVTARLLLASATNVSESLAVAYACYQLTALDAVGQVIQWSPVLCVLPGTAYGAAPTNLSVRFPQQSSSTIALAWNP